MGRVMPVECEHGRVVDWGDFGPDPDDGSIGTESCAECFPATGRTCEPPAHRFALNVGASEQESLRCDCGDAVAVVTFTRGGSWLLRVVDHPDTVEDE